MKRYEIVEIPFFLGPDMDFALPTYKISDDLRGRMDLSKKLGVIRCQIVATNVDRHDRKFTICLFNPSDAIIQFPNILSKNAEGYRSSLYTGDDKVYFRAEGAKIQRLGKYERFFYMDMNEYESLKSR